FALGVFTAFSLAQTAMARQWWTRRDPGWRCGLLINATGAAVTAVGAVGIIRTKRPRGAWGGVGAGPPLAGGRMGLHRHYARGRAQLQRIGPATAVAGLGPAIVPVRRWDRAALDALAYARALRDTAVALDAAASPPPGLPPGVERRRLPGRGLGAVLGEID